MDEINNLPRNLDKKVVQAADFILEYLQETSKRLEKGELLDQSSNFYAEFPESVFVFQILPNIVGSAFSEIVFQKLIEEEMLVESSVKGHVRYFSMPRSFG
jgi:hypothetical protein